MTDIERILNEHIEFYPKCLAKAIEQYVEKYKNEIARLQLQVIEALESKMEQKKQHEQLVIKARIEEHEIIGKMIIAKDGKGLSSRIAELKKGLK